MSVSFVDQDTGWVAGSDSIFKTINGGETWKSLEGLNNHTYSSLFFVNADSGWVTARGNSMGKVIIYKCNLCGYFNSIEAKIKLHVSQFHIETLYKACDEAEWKKQRGY